jgi:hypothetical protein
MLINNRYGLTDHQWAPDLLKLVLAFEGIELDAFTMLMFYAGEGIDPNVNRERLLSPWVKAAAITS